MKIRESNAADVPAIQHIHEKAFGEEEGAEVSKMAADLLMDETALPLVSLISDDDGKPIGNVIFSNLKLEQQEQLSAFLLGPLAILPEYQNRGLGMALVREGLKKLRELIADLVLVYGDPAYYSRFGFVQKHSILAPYELKHPHGWQALEMKEGILDVAKGEITCALSLYDPKLW